jgi:hypothetical protein
VWQLLAATMATTTPKLRVWRSGLAPCSVPENSHRFFTEPPSWINVITSHAERNRAAAGSANQFIDAAVPFFFKQWGGVFKKRHGRMLKRRTWDESPAAVQEKLVSVGESISPSPGSEHQQEIQSVNTCSND